jgi:hypothetical protein
LPKKALKWTQATTGSRRHRPRRCNMTWYMTYEVIMQRYAKMIKWSRFNMFQLVGLNTNLNQTDQKHPKPSFWAWDSMIVCGVKCIILLKGQVIHGSNVIDLLDVYILHFVGTLNAHSCNKSGWSWLCFGFGLTCTLWLFNIAIGNWPFIDGLPIRNGDFPWLC